MDVRQVFRVSQIKDAKRYDIAFAVCLHPQMSVNADASRWLAELAFNCSHAQQRKYANGICHWLNYCLEQGVDYRSASHSDLSLYAKKIRSEVSLSTKQLLTPCTIYQRLRLVSKFYEAGIRMGWNQPYLDMVRVRTMSIREFMEYESKGVRTPAPIDKSSINGFLRHERTKANIRPFYAHELISLLNELGPTGYKINGGLQRDRLIGEWMAFCGLRIQEVLGSNTVGAPNGLIAQSITDLKVIEEGPFDIAVIELVVNQSEVRSISVPFWLVIKTKHYISTERAEALRGCHEKTEGLFVNGTGSGRGRGKRLSIRSYQNIFAAACLRCELKQSVRKRDGNYAAPTYLHRPLHSVHDLRHTFAIVAYHDQVSKKSSEPWRVIQAQMGRSSVKVTAKTYLPFISLRNHSSEIYRISMRELAGLK